jgi:hypothetical protein
VSIWSTTTPLGGCAPIEVVVFSHSNIALALRQYFNDIYSKSRQIWRPVAVSGMDAPGQPRSETFTGFFSVGLADNGPGHKLGSQRAPDRLVRWLTRGPVRTVWSMHQEYCYLIAISRY